MSGTGGPSVGPSGSTPAGRPHRWMVTQAPGGAGQNPAYRLPHHRTQGFCASSTLWRGESLLTIPDVSHRFSTFRGPLEDRTSLRWSILARSEGEIATEHNLAPSETMSGTETHTTTIAPRGRRGRCDADLSVNSRRDGFAGGTWGAT
jgi:hypothetical protein